MVYRFVFEFGFWVFLPCAPPSSAGWSGDFGEDCLSTWPRSGSCEFRSRLTSRATQGTHEVGGKPGRHFLDYFLWPHKESNRRAGPHPAKLVLILIVGLRCANPTYKTSGLRLLRTNGFRFPTKPTSPPADTTNNAPPCLRGAHLPIYCASVSHLRCAALSPYPAPASDHTPAWVGRAR